MQSPALVPCLRVHLEQRCRERGYTMDEVRGCIVSQDDHRLVVDVSHPDYPRTSRLTLAQKVSNFAKSAVRHVASGMPMCTQAQIDERFVICRGCEFYKDDACQKCGCPLVRERRFISKLSWANEKCPVGKWGTVDNGQ